MQSFVRSIGAFAYRWARRYVPDPFVFALVLTLVTLLLGVAFTGSSPRDMILFWQGEKGFWNLLAFGMQMCLILVTGHALANTRPVGFVIRALAGRPRTTRSAAALTALVAMVFSLVNWGLGLIVGALFAREVGIRAREQGRPIHYPLVVAAGYVGLMVWHGGLSGSAPLKVTTLRDLETFLGPGLAARVGEIPLDRTLGSPLNLFVTVALLALVPLCFVLLAPGEGEPVRECGLEADGAAARPPSADPEEGRTFARRLEESPVLPLCVGALGLVWLVHYARTTGFARLDPNGVNLIFLILGLLLYRSPVAYARAISDAVRGTSGIILQFPFYAGIMGMIYGSGLGRVISDLFIQFSTNVTFPLFTFLSAGLLNIFVPSGGGQWAVQGPIITEAALRTGVPVPKIVMALVYGDEWTNMFQPFWALPLLGITGLRARDIIGYTMTVMLLSLPVYVVALLIF